MIILCSDDGLKVNCPETLAEALRLNFKSITEVKKEGDLSFVLVSSTDFSAKSVRVRVSDEVRAIALA